MSEWNYSTLKELARETKMRVNDLIALAPKNDPFYMGTKGDLEWGRWFRQLWRDLRFSNGIHLRRMHYALISKDPPIVMPNNEPYINTETCWNALGEASKAARYLEMVPPENFQDRRNPEPHIYNNYYSDAEPTIYIAGRYNFEINLPDLPDLPTLQVENFFQQQEWLQEVWVEKSTMNDVLKPLCRQYGANLITGAGELSITACCNAIRRIRDYNKKAVIWYVSDFDPAGYGMPISVARKIEYFIRNGNDDLEVRLYPIVLTAEQISTYNLPRTPIKDSETRKGRFEETHGQGAVELDALEALYPGVLAKIVGGYLDTFFDEELTIRGDQRQKAATQLLRTVEQEALKEIQAQYEEITEEWNEQKEEWLETIEELQARLAALHESAIERLEETKDKILSKESNTPDEDEESEHTDELWRRTEPKEMPNQDMRGPLLDTRRDYLDQIVVYQAHRQGEENGES